MIKLLQIEVGTMSDKQGHNLKFKSRKEKIGWFLDEIDSYKEDMGKWYSLFIRIILPFFIFLIPSFHFSYSL